MNNSWSSRQVLSPEDLISLQSDLLGLLMKLQNMDLNRTGIMKDSRDMTLDIISNNLLKDVAGSLRAISINGLKSKEQ